MSAELELLFNTGPVKHYAFSFNDLKTGKATPSPVATGSGTLLDYATLADRLGTSEGWVRRNARRTYTKDPIPTVRLGKFVRFDWEKVQTWMKRRSK